MFHVEFNDKACMINTKSKQIKIEKNNAGVLDLVIKKS